MAPRAKPMVLLARMRVRGRVGPGGPRGLQILRAGVSVRDGFDSHAFPPLLLAVALALMPRAAAGAPAPVTKPVTGRAAVAVKDTVGTPIVKPDSAAAPKWSSPIPKTSAPDTSAGVITIQASRDSVYGPPAPRPRRTLRRLGRFDQPRWVMLRSLLVPGWGQVHNHAWVKAALLAAGDGSLRVRALRDERRLSDLNGQA